MSKNIRTTQTQQLGAQAPSTVARAAATLEPLAKQCDEAQKKPSFTANEIIYSDYSDYSGDEGNPNPEEFNDDGTLKESNPCKRPRLDNPLIPAYAAHLVLQDTRQSDGFNNEGEDVFDEGQYPSEEDVERNWGYRD